VNQRERALEALRGLGRLAVRVLDCPRTLFAAGVDERLERKSLAAGPVLVSRQHRERDLWTHVARHRFHTCKSRGRKPEKDMPAIVADGIRGGVVAAPAPRRSPAETRLQGATHATSLSPCRSNRPPQNAAARPLCLFPRRRRHSHLSAEARARPSRPKQATGDGPA
jgi:hypothetical protein